MDRASKSDTTALKQARLVLNVRHCSELLTPSFHQKLCWKLMHFLLLLLFDRHGCVYIYSPICAGKKKTLSKLLLSFDIKMQKCKVTKHMQAILTFYWSFLLACLITQHLGILLWKQLFVKKCQSFSIWVHYYLISKIAKIPLIKNNTHDKLWQTLEGLITLYMTI